MAENQARPQKPQQGSGCVASSSSSLEQSTVDFSSRPGALHSRNLFLRLFLRWPDFIRFVGCKWCCTLNESSSVCRRPVSLPHYWQDGAAAEEFRALWSYGEPSSSRVFCCTNHSDWSVVSFSFIDHSSKVEVCSRQCWQPRKQLGQLRYNINLFAGTGMPDWVDRLTGSPFSPDKLDNVKGLVWSLTKPHNSSVIYILMCFTVKNHQFFTSHSWVDYLMSLVGRCCQGNLLWLQCKARVSEGKWDGDIMQSVISEDQVTSHR